MKHKFYELEHCVNLSARMYSQDNIQKKSIYGMANALELPVHEYFDAPNISKIKRQNFNIASSKNMVVISPEANSCVEEVSDREWETLADKIENKLGLQVVFNTGDRCRYRRFKHIFFDISQMVCFVNTVRAFIGWRSGLCDVIGVTCQDVKKIIIYPPASLCLPCVADSSARTFLEYYSIKGNFSSKSVEVYI